MTRLFKDLNEFKSAVGQELGVSEWVTIDQEKVNCFAEATGDNQWIHVDVERAANGPFGGTIVHGYMTLAIIPILAKQIFTIGRVKMGINYGVNRVRFPHPVLVGSKVRVRAKLMEAVDLELGTRFTLEVSVEIEGVDKPACVAEILSVRVPDEI